MLLFLKVFKKLPILKTLLFGPGLVAIHVYLGRFVLTVDVTRGYCMTGYLDSPRYVTLPPVGYINMYYAYIYD